MDPFDRRTLPEGPTVIVSTRLERAGTLAAFSERTGGVSEGPFTSLNLGAKEGDDATRVGENRERLIAGLGCGPLTLGEQVHGGRTVRVGGKRAGAGFAPGSTPIPRVDGLVTSSAGLPLAVFVADCVPLILADDRSAAAVHVGWRGLVAGIVPAAVRNFEDPGKVRAALGPAIGPCHFEVGEDVALAISSATSSGAPTERRDGSLYVDLPEAVRRALRDLGLRTVDVLGLCTRHEDERFFSYRRDGRTGRQVGVAMRL